MKEPQWPRGGKLWNVAARKLARSLLLLPLFCGWCLTKAGWVMFHAGADLECWARDKRRGLR